MGDTVEAAAPLLLVGFGALGQLVLVTETVYSVADIANVMDELLIIMRKRHLLQQVSDYNSTLSKFLRYCSDSTLRDRVPPGYALAGVRVTKEIVGRMVYLSVWVCAVTLIDR